MRGLFLNNIAITISELDSECYKFSMKHLVKECAEMTLLSEFELIYLYHFGIKFFRNFDFGSMKTQDFRLALLCLAVIIRESLVTIWVERQPDRSELESQLDYLRVPSVKIDLQEDENLLRTSTGGYQSL